MLAEDVVWSLDPHADVIFRASVHGGPIQHSLTHGLIEDFRCAVTSHHSAPVNCTLRGRTAEDVAYFIFDRSKDKGRKIAMLPRSDSVLGDWNFQMMDRSSDRDNVPDPPSIYFIRLRDSGAVRPAAPLYHH